MEEECRMGGNPQAKVTDVVTQTTIYVGVEYLIVVVIVAVELAYS